MNAITPPAPSGALLGARHLYPVRVHYEDTDLSGMVYHANYLRWFERARSDMLRLLGIDQRAAHEAGEGAYVSWDDFSARAPAEEIAGFVRAVGHVARENGLVAPGYRLLANVGAHGGQEVPHLHVHLFGGRPLGPMIAR